MVDDASTIRTGFVRQRRNLLVTSLVLLAFLNTGATIHTLNVFGNTIDLNRPIALASPLWLAWFYFLIRFYQYLRDLGDKGFASTYLFRVVEYGKREAVKELGRIFRPTYDDIPNPEPPQYDIRKIELGATPPQWLFNITGIVTVRQTKPAYKSWAQNLTAVPVRVPDRRMILPRVRAFWWLVAHTRLTTEYVLPFAVAAAPLAVEAARLLRAWVAA